MTNTVEMLNFHSVHSGVAQWMWAPEIKRHEFKSHLHLLLFLYNYRKIIFRSCNLPLCKKKKSNRPLCKDAFPAKIVVKFKDNIIAVKAAEPVSVQLYTFLFFFLSLGEINVFIWKATQLLPHSTERGH